MPIFSLTIWGHPIRNGPLANCRLRNPCPASKKEAKPYLSGSKARQCDRGRARLATTTLLGATWPLARALVREESGRPRPLGEIPLTPTRK